MARPIKKGLDYHPRDVDWIRQLPVRKIMRAQGPAAAAVLDCIDGYIYGEQGYFVRYDEDARFLIADDVGVKESYVDAVIDKATQVSYYDLGMFSGHSILTSESIQKTYKSAASQKKDSSILAEYSLIQDESKPDNPVSKHGNPNQGVVNTVDNPQSKVKQSKVNKTKTNTLSPSDEFGVEIWMAYPRSNRNGNYHQAQEAYVQAITTGETTKEQVLAKIAEYKAYIELNHIQSGFIKSAGNWFAGHLWQSTWDTETPAKKPENHGRPTRQETEPDWMKPDYKPESKPVTPEVKADIQAGLAELKAMREAKANASTD